MKFNTPVMRSSVHLLLLGSSVKASSVKALVEKNSALAQAKSSDQVTSTVYCGGGRWGNEATWSLYCNDGTTVAGSCEEGETDVTVANGAECGLVMKDTYQDSWNGNWWEGFGQSFSILEYGGYKTDTFTVRDGAPARTMVKEDIKCEGGQWGCQTAWQLKCSDGTTVIGTCTFTSQNWSFPGAVALGSDCTLDMYDMYGDGWNGNEWKAFGQSFTLESGNHKQVQFKLEDASSGVSTEVLPATGQCYDEPEPSFFKYTKECSSRTDGDCANSCYTDAATSTCMKSWPKSDPKKWKSADFKCRMVSHAPTNVPAAVGLYSFGGSCPSHKDDSLCGGCTSCKNSWPKDDAAKWNSDDAACRCEN